jgi:hypothetical protein
MPSHVQFAIRTAEAERRAVILRRARLTGIAAAIVAATLAPTPLRVFGPGSDNHDQPAQLVNNVGGYQADAPACVPALVEQGAHAALPAWVQRAR